MPLLDKTEERHQLSWCVEPSHVADLRNRGHGNEKRSTSHRLIGFHGRPHRPLRGDESELLHEPPQLLECVFGRVDASLKDVRRGSNFCLASQR